jgi:hypothetical protein
MWSQMRRMRSRREPPGLTPLSANQGDASRSRKVTKPSAAQIRAADAGNRGSLPRCARSLRTGRSCGNFTTMAEGRSARRYPSARAGPEKGSRPLSHQRPADHQDSRCLTSTGLLDALARLAERLASRLNRWELYQSVVLAGWRKTVLLAAILLAGGVGMSLPAVAVWLLVHR